MPRRRGRDDIRELDFWLRQWHHEPSPDFDDARRPSDFFTYLVREAASLNLGHGLEALDALRPTPAHPAGRRPRAKP